MAVKQVICAVCLGAMLLVQAAALPAMGELHAKSAALYAANGQVGFLASQRVDGKLVLAEAVKVLVQKSA